MLASECEPWAKTGGLADVVDALARALGQMGAGDVETPIDVFLPRYRGVPEPTAVERTTEIRVPDPRSPSGSSVVTDRRRPGRWLSVAAGRPPGRLRPRRLLWRRRGRLPGQRLAVRAVLPGGPGGADPGRSAGRRAAHPRLAHRAGGDLPRRPLCERPGRRRCRDPDHAAQPGLPRLDAAVGARAARARAGRRRRPGRRRRDRPPARRHRTRGAVQHRLARVRRRGADARVRDGARRRVAREGRPVRRDPQRARHDGLGSRHRRGPRGDLLARRIGPARRPVGRTC